VPLLTLGHSRLGHHGDHAWRADRPTASSPGPRLYIDNPEVFWSVIISMYIGNIVLLILNLPLIPYIARVLAIPTAMLVPLILFFSLIGVYFVSFNTFDIHLMVLFAIVALVLRLLDFPMAPMLLGFILGGMMEENLRRALINNDSWAFLWERPLTATILAIAILILHVQGLSAHDVRQCKD
jgi:putative tricarboxylic transport membrane protein